MFTLNDILQGNAGEFHLISSATPDPDMVFRSAHHDSRQIEAGDLFIAIKGEKVDGHRFIGSTVQAGARGVLCNESINDVPPDFIQIIVPDVIAALQATARVRARRQTATKLIGITGSNGKTSTKDAIATVLSREAPTLKTQASYNTEIGYPLTLLRLEPHYRYAVLEMGAQWVGELASLCTIAAPHWSLVTNVGASHLEFFGSQERVALAKSEIVQALNADGLAILNYDDSYVRDMCSKTQARVLFYGTSADADVRASKPAGDTLRGRSFTLSYHGQQTRVQLHIPGEHGIMIALAAAAVGCAAAIPLEDIRLALEMLQPAKRRGEIKQGPNRSILIDDSYNANRQSIIAGAKAIQTAQLAFNSKRWAVLGDILELGPYSLAEHRATGVALASLVDYIVAIGDQARFFVDGAIEAGMPVGHTYYFAAGIEDRPALEAAKRAAASVLKQQVQSDDVVLLKGSLGVGLDTLLAMLQE